MNIISWTNNNGNIIIISIMLFSLILGIIGYSYGVYKFNYENKKNDYVKFIDNIDYALTVINKNNLTEEDKLNIQLSLNKAFSRAMITMDDNVFNEIANLLDGNFDKEKRNKIYYYMRKDLNPKTNISVSDVISKWIELKNG